MRSLRILALIAISILLTTFVISNANAALPPSVKISAISYPAWEISSIPPENVDYSPYTHVFAFGYYPTSDGKVTVEDSEHWSYLSRYVDAAHAAGDKAILVIGSDGEEIGKRFVDSAKDPVKRASLVADIMRLVNQYGFDGVDIDWEEDVHDNGPHFVALIRDMRAALGTTKFLSFDVVSGLVPADIALEASAYVDTVNIMSYESDGRDQLDFYEAIPSSKLILGLGFHSSHYDTTVARVQAKVDLVNSRGLAGTEFWQIGFLEPTYNDDPRLEPLRQMIK